MKYELGDKVLIKKHWQRKGATEQLKLQGISDLEKHLMSDDMAGDYVRIDKYKKESIREVGFICGIREFKTSYDLEYIFEEPYVKDGIQQMNYQTEKVYLVATKMNTLRRVSFEDIEYMRESNL